MNKEEYSETICAVATGNPTGAISIIRISGKDTKNILTKCFSKNLQSVDSHTLHFGMFNSPAKEVIDEVLVSFFEQGKSYTGEESAEISCHASPYIVQRILETLTHLGCRLADAGEFTMRAYMNGKLDLSQAEAVADLIASQSAKAHEVSLKQLKGGLSNELRDLREKLIHFASMVELELDFAEEDVEFADRTQLLNLIKDVKNYVAKLIQSFQLGNAIKNGVPIALVGRPNAGKSTVLNALLQEERAIVSNVPGTTRDTVEELFIYKGIQFRLIDTAGIRESSDEIEREGIKRSIEKIEKAKLVVYLFDANELAMNEVQEDVNQYLGSNDFILIGTKKDQLTDAKMNTWLNQEKIGALIYINDYDDRVLLLDLMYEKAIGQGLDDHPTIITNARHVDKLQKAQESLQQAEQALINQVSGDFVAMDIRQAMYQIGQITGDISTDDLLGNIFSKFCIGK
ncbi:MAG: tRNA uridine-5-carboxymethylaminomethyl(34) synthesis GTPase MnmE [Bacteroidetes bacterium]|nr:tRNA uridine-5-carboxymethylaminomethyl(34) synthesis GTPase MnmE [Bacteroidota bacterium]